MKTKQTQNQIIFQAVRQAAKIETLSKLVDALDEISDEIYSFNGELSREIDTNLEPVKEKIYELIYQESKRIKTEILFKAK
jgi:archaellum component FlaC